MTVASASCARFAFLLSVLSSAHAEGTCQGEACDGLAPASGHALLQVRKASTCSWAAGEGQDGSKPCAHLQTGSFTSGGIASLDEDGYKKVAKLCCHHEMSLFVRREIAKQGFDICNLPDLHGFIHWYDCSDDDKTFVQMQAEIAGASTNNCPFLGHLPNCPVQGPNCHDFTPCSTDPVPNSRSGSLADLNEAGYQNVARKCCHTEMEAFVRRQIELEGFAICDEGALQGFLHWFDCKDDEQTFDKLKAGLVMARTGLPPMCPWLGSVGQECPPMGHNCPWIEDTGPTAHRRRSACR